MEDYVYVTHFKVSSYFKETYHFDPGVCCETETPADIPFNGFPIARLFRDNTYKSLLDEDKGIPFEQSLAKKIIDDIEVDAYWYSGEEMQENGEALECEEYWVKVTNPHSTYFDDTYDWPFLDTAFEADLHDAPFQMEFTVQYVLSLGIGHIVPVNKTFKYGEKDSVRSLIDCIHAFEDALETPEGIKEFFADCPNAILDGKLLTLIGGAPCQPIESFEFVISDESNPEELGEISIIRDALYSVRCINYRWLDKE